MDQTKMVQARITRFSPLAAWKTLSINSKEVTPNEGAKWEVGGKNLRFLANKSLYLNNGAR